MPDYLADTLLESIKITLVVMVMMIAVDLINVWSRGKFALLLDSAGKWKQYFVASAVGTVPGCMGAFANVSLYMHGMISFGALSGSMIATSGDEAYVMLVMFPQTALILFIVLFLIGLFSSKIIDSAVKQFNIKTCTDCEVKQYHKNEKGFRHYFNEHIWGHIIKHHLWKTFLWTFGALIFLGIGTHYWNIGEISHHYIFLVLILSALVGLIPESGPNLVFVTMFATGVIPFSVLLTNSIVQDGHGLLPMLSYSVKDSIKIKLFNLAIGLTLGTILFGFGL
jgi:Putative, 10TM heavy-metal exporter